MGLFPLGIPECQGLHGQAENVGAAEARHHHGSRPYADIDGGQGSLPPADRAAAPGDQP